MSALTDVRGDRLVLAAVATTLLAWGCRTGVPPAGRRGTAPPPWFAEEAAPRRLAFRYESGHVDRYLMPEIMGGGVALFDMDGDGDLDVFFVQGGSVLAPDGGPSSRLFRNERGGTFEDVTEGSGAGVRAYGMGAACGDYDNDGDVDLLLTAYGGNHLLRNDGGGHFTDVTADAGVGGSGWSTSAAFLDYDRDGDLDLYVAHYLDWAPGTEQECSNNLGSPDYCSPRNYEAPAMDALYRNDGNGRFTDVTRAAGLDAAFGTGLGVLPGDFDGDGWVDVFVANDGMPNQLWHDEGNGHFRDVALLAGCAVDEDGLAKAGMGVAAADTDDDGDLDLVVGNLRNESDSYFRNDGRSFRDATASGGIGLISRPFTRFGLGLVDIDDDGYLDLWESNGRVMRWSLAYGADPYAEPSLVFRGQPGGVFAEVEPRGGVATALVGTSRAAAFGDVDGDGAVDVIVVNRDGPAWLLRNVVPDRGHWILFRVVEEHGRDALGAMLALMVGPRRVVRDVRAAGSYVASSDPRVHVGLGGSTSVSSVVVTWVGGVKEAFGDFSADQVVTLRRGSGRPAAP